MKALLICPADRPAVSELATHLPLAIAPLLGRSVLEFWIEHLAARGTRELLVLASDRPGSIRDHIGDGRRWGVHIEVLPTAHELSVDEARLRHPRPGADWIMGEDLLVCDHLPGQPGLPLFDTLAGWFAAQRAWMPLAATPGRIGVRQLRPSVWTGLGARISPDARLIAPCWIGDHARVGPRATIGPGAIVGDRAVVDDGARIVESTVGPDTYVGKFVSLEQSLAHGRDLVSWRTNSTVRVPDAFLLGDLASSPRDAARTSLPARIMAGVTMAVTAPFAAGVVALSLLRGEAPWHLRLGLRSQAGARRIEHGTFAYYELCGAQNWLRRWPQFWSIMRGDMAWTGNRPLRPSEALQLTNDFERLWLAAPVGLISLADAHGCPDGIGDEATAHASYYAVHANWRLDWLILSRSLRRAAMVWPIRGRRKESSVPLQDLATKQEL